jgi:hypothetical protein
VCFELGQKDEPNWADGWHDPACLRLSRVGLYLVRSTRFLAIYLWRNWVVSKFVGP